MNRNGHDVCRGSCFVTYRAGLPIPGSPLGFPPPRFLLRARMSRPHPFEKGKGDCGFVLAPEVS